MGLSFPFCFASQNSYFRTESSILGPCLFFHIIIFFLREEILKGQKFCDFKKFLVENSGFVFLCSVFLSPVLKKVFTISFQFNFSIGSCV